MDTQTVLNISLILMVVPPIVYYIMHAAGLVKDQYVGGRGVAEACIIIDVAYVVGWGIFIILMITAGDFIMDKVNLLTGW